MGLGYWFSDFFFGKSASRGGTFWLFSSSFNFACRIKLTQVISIHDQLMPMETAPHFHSQPAGFVKTVSPICA